MSQGTGKTIPVDSRLQQTQETTEDIPIDPALFAIEQIVNDARKNKVRQLGEDETRRAVEQIPADGDHEATGDNATGSNDLGILDDEFDPALREIVNSLTNAQQSTSMIGTNLTPAQAQAAIDAHLHDADHDGLALKSFEDLERAGYGMIDDRFDDGNNTFLLPEPEAGPSGSGTYHSHRPSLDGDHDSKSQDRGQGSGPARRGRPKGSKNKPKPNAPPPPPRPIKVAKKRGRPPKQRTLEELAEIERRKIEKAEGIKRTKGRPRKYPGYLVREMRLKKNRSEFRELLNRYEGDHEGGHEGYREDMDMEIDVDMEGGDEQREEGMGDGGGFWTENMERSILAAVEGLDGNGNGEDGGGVGGQEQEQEDVPSLRAFEGGGDMEMRRVFGLADHDNDDHQG